MWLTMLMVTFYPLLDGGVQQIREVFRGLRNSGVKRAGSDGYSTQQGSTKDVKDPGIQSGEVPSSSVSTTTAN